MELLIVLIFLTIVYLYKKSVKPKRFPPGPPKLPYFGGMPFVFEVKGLMQTLRKLVDNYGPLSGVYFGDQPLVVISDYEMLKNLFKKDELTYRPPFIPNNRLRPGWEYLTGENAGQSPGVIMTNGQIWREQRRFLLKNLRDFGFGRNSMESIIQEEMAKVCSNLSKIPQNEATDLNRTMNISVLNALWNILVGERLELDDPKSSKFVTMFDNLFREGGPNTLAQFLLPHPLMMTWPILRDITGYSRAAEVFEQVGDFVHGYVDDHKKTMDPDNARDFTDLMLMEIQNTTDKNSSFYGKMGEVILINDLIDMFLAGMETTSSSLMWTFLYLLHNPDMQKKVHLEIDTIVGRNRFPSLDDRPKMHYTNAVLLESLRTACLVGPGVPHYASEDVEVGDFVIPKGCTVFGSLFHIMNDPNHFKDPHKFQPERFLNNNGEFVNDERVVPFGIGKRVCLGQTLAEKEFFIFFTGFMQQFELRNPDGHVLPSYHTDEYFGKDVLRPPPKFSVNLIHRLT